MIQASTTQVSRHALTLHVDAYRQHAAQAPHAHEDLHFSLVLAGRVEETVGSLSEGAGPLSVVSKDAGVRHADRFGASGARFARLTMPEGTVRSLVEDVTRAPDWRWTHDPAVAAPFLRLVRRFREPNLRVEPTDPDLLDLLAIFTARPAPPTRGTPPAWLSQVMDELRSGWHPRLAVADVAKRAGVHPVYLARCVRRWYGTGVAEELRRLRVRAAAAALAESGQTVSDLAHEHGFSDEAHLSRNFRQVTGMPPGRYRRLMKSLPDEPLALVG